jgi:hypothetical protein
MSMQRKFRDIFAAQSSTFYHDNSRRRRSILGSLSFYDVFFAFLFGSVATMLHIVGAMIRRESSIVKKSSQFSLCVSRTMCITNVIAALQHCLHSIHFIGTVISHHHPWHNLTMFCCLFLFLHMMDARLLFESRELL